jgi:hypothetical protein
LARLLVEQGRASIGPPVRETAVPGIGGMGWCTPGWCDRWVIDGFGTR